MGEDIHRLQRALESASGISVEEVSRRPLPGAPRSRLAGMGATGALPVAQLGVHGRASYYVVLERTDSESRARSRADALSGRHEGLELHVVDLPGDGFAVATSARPQSRTSALVEGSELKDRTGLQPVLVRMR